MKGEKCSLYHQETPGTNTLCCCELRDRLLCHLQRKSMADVGYRVRTGSSPGSFTLQSKVSLRYWRAHSEMGRSVSIDIAGVKLTYMCTGSTFLIFCTHLCFLPWLDLTSLSEAEESHLFWWGFRVLASPPERIHRTGWVHNHEGPGHTKQKGLLRWC